MQKLQKYSAVMQRSKGILFILKFSRKTEILFMDEVLGEAVGISWDPMVWIIIVEFWTKSLAYYRLLIVSRGGGGSRT